MNSLLMLFIIVPILAVLLLGLNLLLAAHKPDEAKLSVYECGFIPVYGQTRSTFQIHFFKVALLFLIFDLEVLLLYPLAVTLYQVSVFGFSVALIFFIVLTIGFILEIGSGAISIKNADIKIISNPQASGHPNSNSYKNQRVLTINQQKVTFSTSAVYSKENLKDITINSYWAIKRFTFFIILVIVGGIFIYIFYDRIFTTVYCDSGIVNAERFMSLLDLHAFQHLVRDPNVGYSITDPNVFFRMICDSSCRFGFIRINGVLVNAMVVNNTLYSLDPNLMTIYFQLNNIFSE